MQYQFLDNWFYVRNVQIIAADGTHPFDCQHLLFDKIVMGASSSARYTTERGPNRYSKT